VSDRSIVSRTLPARKAIQVLHCIVCRPETDGRISDPRRVRPAFSGRRERVHRVWHDRCFLSPALEEFKIAVLAALRRRDATSGNCIILDAKETIRCMRRSECMHYVSATPRRNSLRPGHLPADLLTPALPEKISAYYGSFSPAFSRNVGSRAAGGLGTSAMTARTISAIMRLVALGLKLCLRMNDKKAAPPKSCLS
jgi:hypothetical protein